MRYFEKNSSIGGWLAAGVGSGAVIGGGIGALSGAEDKKLKSTLIGAGIGAGLTTPAAYWIGKRMPRLAELWWQYPIESFKNWPRQSLKDLLEPSHYHKDLYNTRLAKAQASALKDFDAVADNILDKHRLKEFPSFKSIKNYKENRKMAIEEMYKLQKDLYNREMKPIDDDWVKGLI